MLGLGLGVDKPVGNVEEGVFYPTITYTSDFTAPDGYDGWSTYLIESPVIAVGTQDGKENSFAVLWGASEDSAWYIRNDAVIPEISDQAGLGSLATISFYVNLDFTPEEVEFIAWIGDIGSTTGTQFTLSDNIVPSDGEWHLVTGQCNIGNATADRVGIGATLSTDRPSAQDAIYFNSISVTIEDRS